MHFSGSRLSPTADAVQSGQSSDKVRQKCRQRLLLKPDAVADVQTRPAGFYAVRGMHLVRGEEYGAWDCFLQNWFPQSGYELDPGQTFLRYPSVQRISSGDVGTTDLCLAIGSLQRSCWVGTRQGIAHN